MKRLLFLIAIVFFSSPALAGTTIYVSIDEWCPYICLNKEHTGLAADAPGYYVDIIDAIFPSRGYDVEYVVRPWKRALQETRSGALNAILSPAKKEAPDFVFPEEELAHLCWCFYTKSRTWAYRGVESLKNQIVGYLEGNRFNNELDAYLRRNRDNPQKVQAVHGLNFLDINKNKLLQGRITVFIEESATTDHYLSEHDLDEDVVKAGCIGCRHMYMGFSPAREESAEYAAIFSSGLRELRRSGRLDVILSRYGLKDWQD